MTDINKITKQKKRRVFFDLFSVLFCNILGSEL